MPRAPVGAGRRSGRRRAAAGRAGAGTRATAGSTRAIAAELGVAQATVHYTFGTKEDLYREVMEHLTAELIAQVERAAPKDAGFEETIAALAGALWRAVREPASGRQLLIELTMLALRTPSLEAARQGHYRGVIEVTARLVTEAAERTGYRLVQPAETVARFFVASFDGLMLQVLCVPDEAAERVGLNALVSATVALAGGRLELMDVRLD
ncbi:TetR/AcrR family transcriptional regulator [Streptomyces echinatus]|uniref:AcrR family transcriptional regulator n=1 Tax=Streptomyces echinatus TaxID=67293 RepID=A0A7W9PT47_9ACTN|nr:TetR/AcrR family transcriptional regulator [Streptomyces echinatus]MBB5926802.1 AcrR family transcriptional regulator [Streptomyces echinatus]